MGLHRDDKEFRYPGISYLDYKQIDMDRVLTGFLPRLWWRGSPSVLVGSRGDLSIDTFVESFLEHPEQFRDFDPDVTYRWVETHLLDLVNRGRPTQAVAGLRPLHGFTYRFRVSRHSRPYGADEQLYWMIYQASGTLGTRTLGHLHEFFFKGVDPRTASPDDAGDEIDVETQALISLAQVAKGATDRAAPGQPRLYPPLDQAACDRLAEDVMRLLYHQVVIPRSVLVDHLKILFAFHLALYHLRAMKSLPARLSRIIGDATPGAIDDRGGLFVDVAGVPGTACARLAERSARRWYGRIPAFVQATFTVKKLDDFANHLRKQGKLRRLASSRDGVLSVDQLLSLLGPSYRTERNGFAEFRKSRVLATLEGPDRKLDPETADLAALGLDPFTTYIELVTAQRVAFHRKYLTECLDALLLKNRPGALVAQPRGAERRFVLDSRLVEVLLQLALLRPDKRTGDWRTVPLRVDEFLKELKDRYGLYIDEFPPGDDLGHRGFADEAALRANRSAFVGRLREIGFYTDLSDAYITQNILPRYRLGAGEP
ncbi:hypothetical protein [Frankia sp. CiP3]|uniref:methylation-associated defense system protein MAD7 n=1 Tax=Frankia sp. CiP3 TaxID=2880971 RepID=UPI001EF72C78|nr:hypothetical protein [Frankia sp. CiP3]